MKRFITLEGGEGSGKTTVANWLYSYLLSKGYTCSLTREPGGTAVGAEIRNMILTAEWSCSLEPTTELLLFMADRYQHVVEYIRPGLIGDGFVICDRYVDSTVAYQGYGRGVDLGLIHQLNRIATLDFQYLPELTIFLDIPPEKGLRRVLDPNRIERLGLEFHERVYQGFRTLAQESRFVTVDATNPLEEVQADIVKLLKDRGILR